MKLSPYPESEQMPVSPDGLRLAANILATVARQLSMDLDNEVAAAPVVAELNASADALRLVADLLARAAP
jgi:hypothetical protein